MRIARVAGLSRIAYTEQRNRPARKCCTPRVNRLCLLKWRATNMPVISMFYGIIVSLYFLDNKRHKKPHIHAKYQEQEAVVSIADGKVLEGRLPPAKMRLLLAWIEIHKDELAADWELAASGQQPYRIEPLR